MEPQQGGGCQPRRKFLGRFAIPIQSGDTVKGFYYSPLPSLLGGIRRPGNEMKTVVKEPIVAEKNDSMFGDSFCDLEILDGMCEFEAQYTDADSLISSEEQVSSQKTFQNHRNALSSHGTRFAGLRRSPRLNKSHSDVREKNCNPVSKKYAENDDKERQKDDIVSTSFGTDTLEAIDAMDLDNSVFPDEITSPEEQERRDSGQRFSFLHKSMKNHGNDLGRVSRYSTNESVRRSQRNRVKMSESRSELDCLPSTNFFLKKKTVENKVCNEMSVDLLYKDNKGNDSITYKDSLVTNVNTDFVKDLNNGQALKEINMNSLIEVSSVVDKVNHRQKSKSNVKKGKTESDKMLEHSSNSHCVKIWDKKNENVMEIFTDAQDSPVTSSKLLKKQENQINVAVFNKEHNSKSLTLGVMSKRDTDIGTFHMDHHSVDFSPVSERQVEQELKNSQKIHSLGTNEILSNSSKRVQSCSKISKTKKRDMPGVQTPGTEKYENPKIYKSLVIPSTSAEVAPVEFCNPDTSCISANADALLKAQFLVKANEGDKVQEHINLVGSLKVKAFANSPVSEERKAPFNDQFVYDRAQMPVGIDLHDNDVRNENTNKESESSHVSAPNESETLAQDKETDSFKVQKTEGSLRSPFGMNNETCSFLSTQEKMELSSWGLPEVVLQCYIKNGIKTMFQWQAECLSLPKVLDGRNLIYSAPTSAGKTLVAELLLLKRVMESRRKGVFILPFVSVAREKMYYLQKMFSVAGLRVEGFMGSQGPPGGMKNTDIAVCTIEKANNIVNRLLEGKNMNELGIIVVDELHMVGDPHRGYLLELLLTKVMFVSNHSKNKKDENNIQIIGMSATLPNLELLACWLDAQLYSTNFRPVPLAERIKIGRSVYDSTMKKVRDLDPQLTVKGDSDHLIQLCLETVLEGLSVLVFCPTKAWCEKLAESVAKEFFSIGKADSKYPSKLSSRLRDSLNSEGIGRVIEALRGCPVGLDKVLARSVSFGAAFHHAGLTFDERDIIEGGFRNGSIRVLIATSTLSSGVNLPARRVIIRSPVFGGSILDTLVYKQMTGRAGRKGVDTEGESILICRDGEKHKGQLLIKSTLPAITSCLQHDMSLTSSMKRAILEVIVSGVATTPEEVSGYCKCTLLAASLHNPGGSQPDSQNSIINCISFLEENEFIRLQEADGGIRYIGTQLGCAVLASGLSPDEGLHVFTELHRARQCFVLENELHIIYQVTPTYLSSSWPDMDWLSFLNIWESLSEDMKRVAQLVGVEESFIVRAMKGTVNRKVRRQAKQLAVHQRFYTALALHELVQEIPLNTVASKFSASRGILQSLQQSASTFAGMVTVFCNRLGWHNLELLIAQFQDRLHFGIQRELCDLVRLSHLNGQYARYLYNAGLGTVSMVAHADPDSVESILRSAAPFHSNKIHEGETRPGGTIWLSSGNPLTEAEAATLIVAEARHLVEKELGVASIDWTQKTKGITTPRQKLPRLSPGSNPAGRSFLGARRRNSISPNLILQSEAVRGKGNVSSRIVEGGIDSAVTPLGRVKARKRISPLALALRRKSKSPKINVNVHDVSRKNLSRDCEHIQRDLESSVSGHSSNRLSTNLENNASGARLSVRSHGKIISKNAREKQSTVTQVKRDTETVENKKAISRDDTSDLDDTGHKRNGSGTERNSEENNTGKRERKDTKGKAKNKREFIETEKTCNTDHQQKQGIFKSDEVFAGDSNCNAGTIIQQKTKSNSHQNSEKENDAEEMERKDSKSSVKNRRKVVEAEIVSCASRQQESSPGVCVRKVRYIDTRELSMKSAATDAKCSPVKKSSVAGLLFGRCKVGKMYLENGSTDEDGSSFAVPESQEDKSDNVFSPKRKQEIKNRYGIRKTTKSLIHKAKNTELKKTSLGAVEEGFISQFKMAQAQGNIMDREGEILTGHINGLSKSASVGDRSNTRLVIDSDANFASALIQKTCGDVLGNVGNFSFSSCQNSSAFFHDGEVDGQKELIRGKEDSDSCDKNNDSSSAKDFSSKKSTKVGTCKGSYDADVGRPNVIGENSHSDEGISSLSESQKQSFLRTLNSQGFCLEPFEHVPLCHKGFRDREPDNLKEKENADQSNIHSNNGDMRKEQDVCFSESIFKDDKSGPFGRTSEQPAVRSTLIQNCSPDSKRNLSEEPYIFMKNKRRSTESEAPSEQAVSSNESNKSILRVPSEVLKGKMEEETSMYQACSEDVDFGFDFTLSQDKMQADTEINDGGRVPGNHDLDGSYLCSSSVCRGLLENVCEDASRNILELRNSQSLFKKEKSTSEHQSDRDLDQTLCEFKDLDHNLDTKKNETISDSFFDYAFETYLHMTSTSEESFLQHNETLQQENEDSRKSPKSRSNDSDSPEQNLNENIDEKQEKSGNDICDVLERNSFSNTFSQLDITPGTEALLEGNQNVCSDMLIENDVQHVDDQLNPIQTIKSRLSDDLFATPVSSVTRQSQRKQIGVKNSISSRNEMTSVLNNNRDVGCEDVSGNSNGGLNIAEKCEKNIPKVVNSNISNRNTPESISVITNSFCIIDVVNDSRLFKIFLEEWGEQKTYSVGLACEKAPAQPSKGGIGWRIAGHNRTPRRSQRSQEVAGLVIENSDLLIVGIAVCWGAYDAYYVNLRTVQDEALSNSLPTPPLREAVPYEDRVMSIKKAILKEQKKNSTLRAWDVKNCVRLLAAAGLGFIECPAEDPRVASWMLDPGAKELNICNLVMSHNLESLPLLKGIGSSWGLESLGVNTKNPGSCRVRAATESVVVFHLMAALRMKLQELGMLQSFTDIEMTSVVALAYMELTGMGFSNRECEAQKSIMQAQMTSLERQAYSSVGHPFSLTSLDEISQVLYGELHLPSPAGSCHSVRGKRGRGGRGRGNKMIGPTNKEALDKLSQMHPLPALILQWRKINSSLTKVVYPLQQARVCCSRLSMDRIHTLTHNFTATGRVTMHEPNLQNIPKDFNIQVAVDNTKDCKSMSRRQQHAMVNSRIMSQLAPFLTEECEEHTVSLRHALVARSGSVLLAADYSQLELRLLAHLASDEKLMHLLNSGEDVFTMIAAQIHFVNPEEVMPNQRQQAKQICYGLIYGMGARALSEQLNVDEDEAVTFMDKFRSCFLRVQQFMQSTVEKCRKEGYVLTLMGRRRYLPNITSQNVHARGQSERQAVNTAIQGSAADLVKLAMVRIREALRQAFPEAPSFLTQPVADKKNITGAFLVLQLHDELIYEVVSEDVIQVAQLVQSHMEGVQQLSVSLPVKIKVGPSWGAMQTLNL
ncbi:DNA polymerase theta-like [Panulirus ornatus]|uniref:DNA polymerase theta-like n=1 Tax=Panulirus ornatus TaxID=150431 RepID=UPI003A86117A